MARTTHQINEQAIALRRKGFSSAEIAGLQGRSTRRVAAALCRAREAGKLEKRKPGGQHYGGGMYADLDVDPRTEFSVIPVSAAWVDVKERNAGCYRMSVADVTPCAHCGLRGHLAGDPDRCTSGNAAAGLGGEQDSQPFKRRAG